MSEKKYSEIYPLLPKLFDDLEEQILFVVLNFYEEVIEVIKDIEKKIDLEKFKNILDKCLEKVIEFPEAMKILEEKSIIEEYNKGGRLYVKNLLKKSSILDKFLEQFSTEYKEMLIDYALKAFYDQLYELYKVAEEDGDPWW